MKKKYTSRVTAPALLLLCVLIAISIVLVLLRYTGHCSRMTCVDMAQKSSVHLRDIYEETDTVFRGMYELRGSTLLLRVDVRQAIEPSVADEYIQAKITGMNALYDNIRSPYPGIISNEITCEKEYKPVYSKLNSTHGVPLYQIRGYLNDRYVFGACQKEQIRYVDRRLLFVCPKKSLLYDIEFITPVDEPSLNMVSEIIQSIACKS